jgi:alcohol dehydrogenase class IV
VIATVSAVLADAGIPARLFTGILPNPTTDDLAAGAEAAIDAVATLREQVGLTKLVSHFGITGADFAQIAADALDDEMLADTPRQPTADDIGALLSGSPPGAP